MKSPQLLPRPPTSLKLFVTGATVGPIVDSLHNRCLLTYDFAPMSLSWPTSSYSSSSSSLLLLSGLGKPASDWEGAASSSYFFCSSWVVLPLLGIAYVVLGGILPRIFQALLDNVAKSEEEASYEGGSNDTERLQKQIFGWKKLTNMVSKGREDPEGDLEVQRDCSFVRQMRNRAALAVTSTAAIIKLSEFLQTHDNIILPGMGMVGPDEKLGVMLFAALTQWALLDGSPASLLAASITSIGGPLSELPFVAGGFWHYIASAADYLPLSNVPDGVDSVARTILGEDFRNLALSKITGPCYFAVTMDAIALGRWFDVSTNDSDDSYS